MPSVSVIIPTFNAGKELISLFQALLSQTCKPDEIFVIDSSSQDETLHLCRTVPFVKAISIEQKDFNHGGTRDFALKHTTGDIVVFLTQDAIPADSNFIKQLIAPLGNPSVAVSYARQLPKESASFYEKCIKSFNYPTESRIRSRDDISTLGIKAFFCSNSASAYRRDVYLTLGGFETDVKTNEDMFFAAKSLKNGFSVAYCSDACVYHSHNFTLKQQYHRNYIEAWEMERHRFLLCNVPPVSEGKKMVFEISKDLLSHGHFVSWICFGFDCVARYFGFLAGKKAYQKQENQK